MYTKNLTAYMTFAIIKYIKKGATHGYNPD